MFEDQSVHVYFSLNSSELLFSLGLVLSIICETNKVLFYRQENQRMMEDNAAHC